MLAASREVEAQILQVLDRMDASMTAGDIDEVGRADQGDIGVVGELSTLTEVFIGSEGVDAYFALVREHEVTASWAWKDRRVWASGDMAWAYADSDFTYTFEGSEHTLPYRLTTVCQRRDGEWRIVLYHGSEPATGP